jgi:DNA-binding LacI/PurR family transcriptional regulator
MSGRPSLKDVAAAAGVSHMTVSRVVRGERTVRAATAGRVRRAVEKLHYRPDPALSALAAYRTRGNARGAGSVLAFLEAEKSAYSRLVRDAARDEAARLGYSVDTFPLPESATGQRRLSRLLFHRGITGLLIGPSSEPRRLEGWDWSRFSPVAMGVLRHEPAMHAVAMDYFHGLLAAHAGLRGLGCRRVGLFLREDLEARTGHLWLGAYLSIARPTLKPLLFEETSGLKGALKKWLAAERPDGVLTIHREWHETLERKGIACAYLNDVSPHPGAPYLRLHAREIGRESVQSLHLLLLRREPGLPEVPKITLLRGQWQPAFPAA